MKVHLTKIDNITAKTGVEYVIAKGVSVETGDTVEAFMTKEQSEAFGLKAEHAVTDAQLKEAFGGLEPVEMYFNQRGRVEKIVTK